MECYTAKEAHDLAILNRKSISIARNMVAQLENEFYETGMPVAKEFPISPCYKWRAISWIKKNYPTYTIKYNDVFSNASCITISMH